MEGQRWGGTVWALWRLDNEETRLFLELDFPEGRRVGECIGQDRRLQLAIFV